MHWIYNKPKNLDSAGVFSDPPINISDVKKNGDIFSLLQDSVNWKSKNVNLKDGNYKVGIRPHNITTYKESVNSIEIKGKVLISELSGSESLICLLYTSPSPRDATQSRMPKSA